MPIVMFQRFQNKLLGLLGRIVFWNIGLELLGFEADLLSLVGLFFAHDPKDGVGGKLTGTG